MAIATIFLVFAAIVGVLVALVYFVGVPAEWKAALQGQIVDQMAESQAKDMIKDNLGKIPEADARHAKKLEKGINKMTGGDLKNPLGKFTGDLKNE